MQDQSYSETPSLSTYMRGLQEETFRTTAIFVGVLGCVWILHDFWPTVISADRSLLISPWLGGWILVLGAAVSYVLGDRHLRITVYVLTGTILLATVCGVLVLASPSFLYLLVVPIMFGFVLIGQAGLIGTAAAAIALAIAIAIRFSSKDVLLPVGVIVMVTFAAWLAERNLRIALVWSWNSYEVARRNQEIARTRAAELQKTLTALDEATYRLERANYLLALARDQAKESRRLKQQFAQTISHELRTPLNLIVGFTELMAQTPDYYGVKLTPTYLRDLSIVYRNACHLQGLVNDILDLAWIEAAQMGRVVKETDPTVLVQEAMNAIRGLVEARGLTFRAELAVDLPMLRLDPVRIRQVLLNLVSNAVRFTSAGSITIGAERQSQDVVFSVSDTGIGIAAEDQRRIFEEFQQANGHKAWNHEGAGLGLAISKRFVALHGGRIWLESELGVGSTFYFSLPIKQADQETLEADMGPGAVREQTLAEQSLPQLTSGDPILLLVTRSAPAAALLTRHVHGCCIVTVSELSGAESLAKRFLPQVIVVDTNSDHCGACDISALAGAWGLSSTDFVAVPLPGEESVLRRLAIQGYLVKPVSRESLWNAMRGLGEYVERVLLVDDDRDFVRLLSRLLEGSLLRPYQVVSAFNGQQAMARLHEDQPQLLILDLGLPDIDGRDIIAQIRADAIWQDLPIIVVSAQDSVDYQNRLPGIIRTTRAAGLLPNEIVRLVQGIVDTALTSSTLEV